MGGASSEGMDGIPGEGMDGVPGGGMDGIPGEAGDGTGAWGGFPLGTEPWARPVLSLGTRSGLGDKSGVRAQSG